MALSRRWSIQINLGRLDLYLGLMRSADFGVEYNTTPLSWFAFAHGWRLEVVVGWVYPGPVPCPNCREDLTSDEFDSAGRLMCRYCEETWEA